MGGNWTVTLTYTWCTYRATVIVYTRMRAPYVNAAWLPGSWFPAWPVQRIGKMAGCAGYRIGDPTVRSEFHARRATTGSTAVPSREQTDRDLIAVQPDIARGQGRRRALFAGRFPGGGWLCFHVPGVIKEVERLERLFELFAETLHQLCHIGSAYQTDPGLKL